MIKLDIQIRDIIFEDFNAIKNLMIQVHTLHQQNRPDIYEASKNPLLKSDFRNIVENKNIISIAAEIDSTIVGFCIVTIRPPSENPLIVSRKTAFMEDICVHSDYHRKGIGKLIYNEILRRLKILGIESLELMVWSFNESAIQFYKNMGMNPRSIIMETKL